MGTTIQPETCQMIPATGFRLVHVEIPEFYLSNPYDEALALKI